MAAASIRVPARKQERLEARLSWEQKELLQRAADLQGLSLTDFVVSTAAQAARQVIHEHQIIALSESESMALAEALSSTAPAGERLLRAAERYRTLIG